ncbi:MAG: ribosome maturation factor RimP [Nitrospirae bacterium]|nr:ribosome maturation factor RimP [Nitrospirota bacterium]
MAEPTCTEPPRGARLRDFQQTIECVRAIAAPIVRALGLELVEVECVGQGARTILRVCIDKPGGVTLSDCEQVHLSLGHALDVEDPIPHAYTLEVSSPGLDRPLKRREDYRRALGQQVSIKLKHPLDGQWRVVGRLVDMQDTGVTLTRANQKSSETIMVEWADIAEARREVEF